MGKVNKLIAEFPVEMEKIETSYEKQKNAITLSL